MRVDNPLLAAETASSNFRGRPALLVTDVQRRYARTHGTRITESTSRVAAIASPAGK